MDTPWLFSDPRMLGHLTPPDHPERPERLRSVLNACRKWGFDRTCHTGAGFAEVERADLDRVHSAYYLSHLDQQIAGDRGQIEEDTWVSSGSGLAARLAAGAAVAATDHVLSGKARHAFCAIRPPGHHALPGAAMGFCLYGNIAVAAAHALATHQLNRILIVDFDIHHGNGTQKMFYDDARVGFFSMHRWPFYPWTGARDETGTSDGLGATHNLPVAYKTCRSEILNAFRSELHTFADRIRPELVLLSAGFDAHRLDPVGDLGLESEDYKTLTENVLEVARAHASGRIVSLLEGGYNVDALAESVVIHLEALGAEVDLAH